MFFFSYPSTLAIYVVHKNHFILIKSDTRMIEKIRCLPLCFLSPCAVCVRIYKCMCGENVRQKGRTFRSTADPFLLQIQVVLSHESHFSHICNPTNPDCSCRSAQDQTTGELQQSETKVILMKAAGRNSDQRRRCFVTELHREESREMRVAWSSTTTSV